MCYVPACWAPTLAVPTLIDGGTSISLGKEQIEAPPFPLPPTPISMCHGIVICIIALQLADERDRSEEKKKKKDYAKYD